MKKVLSGFDSHTLPPFIPSSCRSPVEEAQAKLKELIDNLVPGDEVVITQNQQPVAKLVAARSSKHKPRQPGTLRGTVLSMSPDFDAPLGDFKV